MEMNKYQQKNYVLIKATCFQKLLDFSLRKIKKLGTLLPKNFDFSSIIINSTACLNKKPIPS